MAMYRTQAADDLALMEWCFAQEHEADILRAPYLEDQEMLLSFYMNQRRMPLAQGLEWMSGELLADSMLLTESFLPNVAEKTLGGKSIAINAYTMAGTEINKALDKAVYRMRARANFEHETIPSIRMCAITGHAFQKNILVEEYGQKRTPIFSNPRMNAFGEMLPTKIVDHKIEQKRVFYGPRTFYPDNQRIWKSAARDMLGRPLVWIEEPQPLDLDYMIWVDREYRAEYGEPFYNYLDELKNDYQNRLARSKNALGNAGYQSPSRRRTATQQAAWMGNEVEGGPNTVCVRHLYARVPEHIYNYGGQAQERLIVYTPDGLKLRDVEAPTWNLYAPFHDIKFMQVANEPFGRSPLYWALPEIEQRSEMRNLRMAEAYLNVFQTRVANRNANFDQHDNGIFPGGVWMYDHDSIRAQDALAVMPRQPVMQEIYREDALMEDHINRVYGSTPNMQGEGLGARATAREASLVDARAGGRADLISAQLAWQYELEAARDYLETFAAFSDEPLVVQVDGEEREFPVEILAEEIDFDYDIEINTGGWGVTNGANLQAMQMIIGAALSNPETVAFELDSRLALSNLQHQTGMPNVLRPRREAMQLRQQAQEAQMLQLLADQAGSAKAA